MASDRGGEKTQHRVDAESPATNDRTMAVRSEAIPKMPNDAPDGGGKAWAQVFASFCLYFNTWGLVSSFGTFQAIYETNQLKENSAFQISVIGSLQTFLMVFLGLFTGPIYDAGYFRHLLTVGSVLVVAGTLAQSFCVRYWHFILTQGLMVGLGAGCLCLLSVAVPSLWFTKKLPLANGLAASGSGIGGVVLPIMIREVYTRAGFGWASRSLALLSLVLLGLSNLIVRDRHKGSAQRKIRSLIDPAAFRDWPYLLFVSGCCVLFLGIYTPFVHIPPFSLRQEISSPSFSLYILAILNSTSIPGRILPNLVANRVGPMNLIVGTALALSITSLSLMAVSSLGQLLAIVVVFGFFSGTFFSLQPTIFVRLSSDPAMIGTRFGMAFAAMSLALLFGPPIAGALLGETGYNAAWIWSGVAMAAGGCLILTSRVLKARTRATQVL